MALSADTVRRMRSGITGAIQIINAEVIYAGSYLALASQSHTTAASRGRVDVFNDTGGMAPLGFANKGATGDTSASPIVEAEVELGGGVVESVAVTGASAATDVGRLVYMTDDNTFTLTRPTTGVAIGVVIRWQTSTTCDVLLFSFAELCILALGGSGQELWNLGYFDANTVAVGNIRTGIAAPYHGAFLEVFGIVDVAPAGSGGTAAINLEIGGTNVTGGVVTIATGDSKSDKKAGTSITAANVFHEGDLIDIEASSVVDMTAGAFSLYAVVERRIGA